MGGPWEDYQSPSDSSSPNNGPWNDYSSSPSTQSSPIQVQQPQQPTFEQSVAPENVIPGVANAITSPLTSLIGKTYDVDKNLIAQNFPKTAAFVRNGLDYDENALNSAKNYVSGAINNSPAAQAIVNGPVVGALEDTAKVLPAVMPAEGALENAAATETEAGSPFFSGTFGKVIKNTTPSPIAGIKTIAKGVKALDPEDLYDTADQIKGNLYNNPNIATTKLNQDAGDSLSSAISNIIPNQNTKGGKSLYKSTINAINDLNDDISNGHLSLDVIDKHRQVLGNIGKDITNPNKAQEALVANNVIDALDDHLNSLGQSDLQNGTTEGIDTLNQARAAYAKSKSYERIADVVKASGGDNAKLQRLISNFANKDKNLLGLNSDERDALYQAANPGAGQSSLAALGKLSPLHKNPIGSIASGALLTAASHPIGLATVAGAIPSRLAAEAMTRGNVRNLLETIESRAAPSINPELTAPQPSPAPQALLPSPQNMTALPMRDAQIAIAQGGNRALSGQTGGNPVTSPYSGPATANVTPEGQAFAAPSPVSESLLGKIQQAESGGNPNAKNPNSTASGPYQFTSGTWKDLVNKYGKDTGIKMADKSNPAAQHTMATLFARDNAQQLSNTLGRDPSPGEVYMAHVFGPTGATKLISSPADQAAKDLFPSNVVKANRSIFFDKIRPRSASEVYGLLDSKVS